MWVIPEDLGNFSSRRKNFAGAKICTSFGINFLRLALCFPLITILSGVYTLAKIAQI
jgi:hypothetical protein